MPNIESIAAAIFGIALVHTFSAKAFARLAHRSERHAGLFHLLGGVEVLFAFWAFVFIPAMAMVSGGPQAIAYAETRQFAEPLFVFVIMVVAASRTVLAAVQSLVATLAALAPPRTTVAQV